MMKKIFVMLITVVILTISLTACEPQKAVDLPVQGGVVQSPPASTDTTTPPNTTSSPAAYDDDNKYAIKDNLKAVGDTVEYCGIEYTVTDIQFTKELGDADQSEINYFDSDERDPEGKLLGSKSYAFISLSIQNISDQKLEELVNRPLVTVLADNRILETGAECRCIVNPQEGQSKLNSHHFILEPGESAKLEAIYIIDDEFVTEDLYFLVGVAGGEADSAQNKFIQIGNEG